MEDCGKTDSPQPGIQWEEVHSQANGGAAKLLKIVIKIKY